MNFNRTALRGILFITIFTVSGIFTTVSASVSYEEDPRKIIVVVNKVNAIDSLTLKELSKIFLKKKSSIDGQSVKPVNLSPDKPIRKLFDERVHDMNSDEIQNYWERKTESEKTSPPITQDSPIRSLMLLTRSRRAIAYVPADIWDEEKFGGSLKILPLKVGEGSSDKAFTHDDEGYPLK